jgi:hypothetical protein
MTSLANPFLNPRDTDVSGLEKDEDNARLVAEAPGTIHVLCDPTAGNRGFHDETLAFLQEVPEFGEESATGLNVADRITSIPEVIRDLVSG